MIHVSKVIEKGETTSGKISSKFLLTTNEHFLRTQHIINSRTKFSVATCVRMAHGHARQTTRKNCTQGALHAIVGVPTWQLITRPKQGGK